MPRAEVINWSADGKEKALRIDCPGCGTFHAPVIGRWTWNGDIERPTLTPSILVRWTQITPEGMAMMDRGDRPPAGERYPCVDVVCHSFVTDGCIQFLGDCTHALAGQTVDLPEVE